MALSQVGLERLNTATTKKIGTSKNILHNGSFIVHQRGGTTTTSGFLLDRWYVSSSGGTATALDVSVSYLEQT